MERLDYRIPDFQTPLLQNNISDIQNSSTNYHIHRSIDTLRSLTDRATLNITLAAQNNLQQTGGDNDPRGPNSPNLENHNRLLNDHRISPNDRNLIDHHQHHQHRALLDPNSRISPELDHEQENRDRMSSQQDQQRYLNTLDYQQNRNGTTNATTNEYNQHRNDEPSATDAQEYQDRHANQQRILNLQRDTLSANDNSDYQHRLDFARSVAAAAAAQNSAQRMNETADFNSANHNTIKTEFGQQRTSTTDNRYDNDYLNRCTNSDEFRQSAQRGNTTNEYTSPRQQHTAGLGGTVHNKPCGTLGDGASYTNSSPSSPGTPISIEGGNNFNADGEKVFGSKADLQLHTQMHMREAKPYKCSQCCKAFANSSYLSQHTRIHLGIKPYRCEICQRKFTQLSHLQQHIRTHTGDKPYKCRHPGCQKAFSQLSNLQSHSRCHQTDKPYKCNSCYKCFSDEPSLLEHIPKHKESKHLKTHICQYCGKSYTQETYLQKHMQKHSERVDKRPPITGAGGPLTGLNRNLLAAVSAAGVASLESPYWSKLSPDTMSSLDLERLEYHNHHSSGLATNAAALLLERNSGTNLGLLERSANTNVQNLHLEHRNANYGAPTSRQNATDGGQTFNNSRQTNDGTNNENIPENNSANRTTFDANTLKSNNPDRNSSNPGSQHNNHDNIGEDLVVSNRHCRVNSPPNENSNVGANSAGPNGANTYDTTNKSGYEISISRSVTNSAFTPISGINHLSLNHPMNRPYLYDALSFQNKELNLNLNKSAGNSNAFPNQLISLHQIRNYAHQPSSIGSSDHILGLKDK